MPKDLYEYNKTGFLKDPNPPNRVIFWAGALPGFIVGVDDTPHPGVRVSLLGKPGDDDDWWMDSAEVRRRYIEYWTTGDYKTKAKAEEEYLAERRRTVA